MHLNVAYWPFSSWPNAAIRQLSRAKQTFHGHRRSVDNAPKRRISQRKRVSAFRAIVLQKSPAPRKDAGNVRFKYNIIVNLERIGDALWTQNDRPGALAAYREGLAAARDAAAAAPDDADSQATLVQAIVKLAESGDDPPARLSEALAILVDLQSKGRLPADQQSWIGLLKNALARATPPGK
jgi:hypothetical protein